MSLFRSSGADATWRSYERFWREWHDLVSGLGVGASAEDRLHVLPRFLGRSCENGVSVASLNVKMAGLAILFQFNGVEEVTKGVCVTQGFAGLAKRSDSGRSVLFHMLEVLVGVLPRVCSSLFGVRLFRSAFVLAFFGAWRVGELAALLRRWRVVAWF